MTFFTHFGRRRPLKARCVAVSLALLVGATSRAHAQAPSADESADEAATEGGKSDEDSEAAAAEAEANAELAAEEARATEALRKPPPKGKGAVWGSVTDTKFNEAVIEAQVQVMGRKEKALTDVEGRYRLDLPPGSYRLRVTYELHRPARVDEVVVRDGQIQRVDVKLVPDESAVEEVVIEEEVDRTTAEGQALSRKNSAVVGDGVGRAEIARTPDKNAAEAAQRVVGATIVGGRFVYVRGLGERYTNALLNGAPLPSPEPDRNTVPLDLFPSLVLDSLNIVKQFTPDMPGDFAGGSVRIQTRDFPKQRLLQIALTGGFNTQSTFRHRLTDYQSNTEWLGYDNGRRQLPKDVPNRKLDSSISDEQRLQYGRELNTPMNQLRKVTPPNFGITLVAGDATKLNADTKLGSLLALTYSHSYQLDNILLRKYRAGGGGPGTPNLLLDDDFSGPRSTDTVRWGAFGSLSLEIARNHTLSLTAMRSQSADDTIYDLEGNFGADPKTRVHADHMEYVSRSLNFLQLRGQHRFPRQEELEIDWHASIALADRSQPDTRDARYRLQRRGDVDGWLYSSDLSGQHQFLDQDDRTLTVGLDVIKPLSRAKEHEVKLKAGTLVTSRDREFSARRFQFVPDPTSHSSTFEDASFCAGSSWRRDCPGYLFRPELVGPGGLVLDEWTLALDKYKTGLDVYGGYLLLDAQVLPQLRAIGGIRSEITYQIFTGTDPFDATAAPVQSNIYQTNWLPALSLVYTASQKTNLRAGVSQTVARPQLRELSPALFTSPAGDRNLQGNPRLAITKIVNADLRLEYFPTLKQVLAASVFYKHFAEPIEEIIASNGTQGFANAEKADLIGVELEGRVGLEVLSEALKPFTGIANLTLVASEVELGARKGAATNDHRPLGNQSPYVANLQLDYQNDNLGTDFRVLYNVYGPRIVVVGAQSLPDIYELPRHQLDAAVSKKLGKHFELKLQAINLLFAPFVYAYRNQPAFREDDRTTPPTFTSVGRNPETRKYQPGATFNLQVSYTY